MAPSLKRKRKSNDGRLSVSKRHQRPSSSGTAPSSKEYKIKDIIDEDQFRYKIDWADDSETGETYSPTWEPKAFANELAIAAWETRKQKDRDLNRQEKLPSPAWSIASSDSSSRRRGRRRRLPSDYWTASSVLSERSHSVLSPTPARIFEAGVNSRRRRRYISSSPSEQSLAAQLEPGHQEDSSCEKAPSATRTFSRCIDQGGISSAGPPQQLAIIISPHSDLDRDRYLAFSLPRSSSQSSIPCYQTLIHASGSHSNTIRADPGQRREKSLTDQQGHEARVIPDSQSQLDTSAGLGCIAYQSGISQTGVPLDKDRSIDIGANNDNHSHHHTRFTHSCRYQAVEQYSITEPIDESQGRTATSTWLTASYPLTSLADKTASRALDFSHRHSDPSPDFNESQSKARSDCCGLCSAQSVEYLQPLSAHNLPCDEDSTASLDHHLDESGLQSSIEAPNQLQTQVSFDWNHSTSSDPPLPAARLITSYHGTPSRLGIRSPCHDVSKTCATLDSSSPSDQHPDQQKQGADLIEKGQESQASSKTEASILSQRDPNAARYPPDSKGLLAANPNGSSLDAFALHPPRPHQGPIAQPTRSTSFEATDISLSSPDRGTRSSTADNPVVKTTVDTAEDHDLNPVKDLTTNSFNSFLPLPPPLPAESAGLQLQAKYPIFCDNYTNTIERRTDGHIMADLADVTETGVDGSTSLRHVQLIVDNDQSMRSPSVATRDAQGTLSADRQPLYGSSRDFVAQMPPTSSGPLSIREPSLGSREYVVPLPMSARVRDLYQQVLFENDREIKVFTRGEPRSLADLHQDMGEMIQVLDNVITHQDLGNEGLLTQPHATDQDEAIWAEKCSAKFVFLKQLLRLLRPLDSVVAIAAASGQLLDILDTFLRGNGITHQRLDHDSDHTDSEGPYAPVLLVPTGSCPTWRSTPKPVDVVIAFDSTFNAQEQHMLKLRAGSDSDGLSPVLRLVVLCSSEHLALCLPDATNPISRMQTLITCIDHTRDRVGYLPKDHPNVTLSAAQAAIFAAQQGNHDGNRSWLLPPLTSPFPPPLESEVQTSGSTTQSADVLDQHVYETDNPSLTQKRPRNVDSDDDAAIPKRSRVGTVLTESDPLPKDPLPPSSIVGDATTKQLVDVEVKLKRSEDLCYEWEQALRALQARFEDQTDALRDMRNALDELQQTASEGAAAAKRRAEKQAVEVQKLKAERVQLQAELQEARQVMLGVGATDVTQSPAAQENARQASAESERLAKKLASQNQEVSFLREQYQIASNAAVESAAEVEELRKSNQALAVRANSEATELRAASHAIAMQRHLRKIEDLTLLLRSREDLRGSATGKLEGS